MSKIDYDVLIGDCLETMKQIEPETIDCVVTSPPYWGLRDYGESEQIGLEDTPEAYVEKMVSVFRKVKRILKPCGTVWLNLGDSYWGGKGQSGMGSAEYQEERRENTPTLNRGYHNAPGGSKKTRPSDRKHSTIKPKDLVGIPWRVALALQADGWWLRQDIIWHKPNPMPESVTDRCTKNHEYIFLLTKSKSYFYDYMAIKENMGLNLPGRNKRSVWTVTTQSFTGAHFAIFPPDLIEPCILAGTSAHGCCGDCGAPWTRTIEHSKLGWQPTCECYGKLVKRDVVIPAILTREEVTKVGWGASLDGSYHGKAQKEYEGTGAENASDVKKRIIENATKDRIKTGMVYESDLALDKHPVVPSVVFDPFGGSGTTAGVAIKNGRRAILCELNEDYIEMMEDRIAGIANGWRKGQMTLGDFN